MPKELKGEGHNYPTCVLFIVYMRDDSIMFMTVNVRGLYIKESLIYCITERLNISSPFIIYLQCE